mgnify:CR=1 FL=1
MKEKIIFEGNSKFKDVKFDKNSGLFYFYFEEISLIPTDFWRVFKENKFKQISIDHGLKYHFNKPKIDLIPYLLEEFQNEYLHRIEVSTYNDLILFFSSDKKIEIYVTSMAFENWEITIKSKQYVCLQGGDDIATFK